MTVNSIVLKGSTAGFSSRADLKAACDKISLEGVGKQQAEK